MTDIPLTQVLVASSAYFPPVQSIYITKYTRNASVGSVVKICNDCIIPWAFLVALRIVSIWMRCIAGAVDA